MKKWFYPGIFLFLHKDSRDPFESKDRRVSADRMLVFLKFKLVLDWNQSLTKLEFDTEDQVLFWSYRNNLLTLAMI